MVRRLPFPIQKVTLNLREGDWDWLIMMHGRKGASKVIRDIVIGHVERSRSAAAQRADRLQLKEEEV